MKQGLYLYCLARLSRLPSQFPEGLGREGLNTLQVAGFQDLAAVWSPVPLQDFCGPEAADHLQDLTWVGPRVIRHQQVVAGVMRHSTVLPARFGTIFSSLASLEEVLHQRHDVIHAFLERLTNQEEWAVKGLLHRPTAKERLFSRKLVQKAAGLGDLSPGKRYFQEQRLRAECDQELPQWLQEVCRELWNNLGEDATEVRERRLLSREATGGDRDMVLNWAFLVPEDVLLRFQARIQVANDQFAEGGLRLESTGPWPPYSFCPTLNLDAEP